MTRTLCLIAFIALNIATAQASVWDEAKQEANSFSGQVESIRNDGNDTVIRVHNSKQTETFRVCSSFPGGDALNLNESERLRMLREAFREGTIVRVSYDSSFDRCLSAVELNKNSAHAETDKR